MSQHGIGARVSHVTYGDGTVEHVNEYHTTIDFDTIGLRKFATSMVVLQSSDTAKPVKAPKSRARAKKATTAKVAVQPQPSTEAPV